MQNDIEHAPTFKTNRRTAYIEGLRVFVLLLLLLLLCLLCCEMLSHWYTLVVSIVYQCENAHIGISFLHFGLGAGPHFYLKGTKCWRTQTNSAFLGLVVQDSVPVMLLYLAESTRHAFVPAEQELHVSRVSLSCDQPERWGWTTDRDFRSRKAHRLVKMPPTKPKSSRAALLSLYPKSCP